MEQQPSFLGVFDSDEKAKRLGAGSLALGSAVCSALNEAIRLSPLSRCQIAERMRELIGREISTVMINGWTSEQKNRHRFPLEFAPAFMAATDNRGLLTLQAEPLGCRVFEGEDVLLVELGRIERQKREIAERERGLRAMLDRRKR